MLYFLKYYLVNSFTFASNMVIYLFFVYINRQGTLVEYYNSISIFSHIFTIPISFFLNYYYVFPNTNQSKKILISKFIFSSILFVFIFELFHRFLLNKIFLNSPTHIIITVICSALNFCLLRLWVFKRCKVNVEV